MSGEKALALRLGTTLESFKQYLVCVVHTEGAEEARGWKPSLWVVKTNASLFGQLQQITTHCVIYK